MRKVIVEWAKRQAMLKDFETKNNIVLIGSALSGNSCLEKSIQNYCDEHNLMIVESIDLKQNDNDTTLEKLYRTQNGY